MTVIHRHLSPLAAVLLAACTATPDAADNGPDIVQSLAEAPPGAAPGTCWGKIVTPAIIETVTEQVMVTPAEAPADGTPAPATFETETRQQIVTERQVTWFETPCRADLPPDFIASLQRALKARSLYRGPVSGTANAQTRAAVRAFQREDGLDSGMLSLASARKLGLAPVELPEPS